ncbi:SDR family NAD(P)-dependent oxidoreductase [Micromonospora chalcea]
MARLSDRKVLVTGGSGYVGSEVVRALLAEGAKVANLDLREGNFASPDRARLRTLIGDVADTGSCEVAVARAVDFLGGLDALICAAGVMLTDDGELGRVSEKAWDGTLSANAKGAWLAATHSLRWLRGGSHPSITFIGSIAADRGSTTSQLAYSVSKGAVAALTTELAVSLAPVGIRVNRVSPGPLHGGVLGSRLREPGAKERRELSVPVGRLGEAQDVARACVFLVESTADYVTGINLVVDGGISVRLI